MENNSIRFTNFIILIILMAKCSSAPLVELNKRYTKSIVNFGNESIIKNINDHFPHKIKNFNLQFYSSPPSCPPTFDCIAQYGDIYLIVNKSDYEEQTNSLMDIPIEYQTEYTEDNIIINLNSLKQDVFSVDKCNKCFSNKLPIPYFESYDFGLGKNIIETKVKNDTLYDYQYTIPDDLEVCVIKAESGDFWKKNCNEKRPASLKEWQHGYSKGFAISKKENKIVYWTMVW